MSSVSPSRFRSLRNAFISGLFLLLPLAATFWVILFLLNTVGAPASQWLFYFLDAATRSRPWVEWGLSILSTGLVVIIITVFGLLSRYFLGRLLMRLVDRIFTAVPFVKTIYKTIKQIVDTFHRDNQQAFQQVVVIEYPRPGNYAIAFQTSTSFCEIHQKVGEPLVHVFMPTTPNPTSGFLLFLPKSQVRCLDMSIGDAMKLIISGGAVVPTQGHPSEAV